MVLVRILCSLQSTRHVILQQAKRNIGISAAVLQKSKVDPIQQMFVDKIREYAQKSKAVGGKLVDASAVSQQKLKDQLAKLDTVYNASGQDMTQFPTFSFTDPELDPITLGVEDKVVAQQTQHAEDIEEEEDNKPYFD